MKRKEDWPSALERFIEAARKKPFAWGKNDCVLFAADAVRAMTGIDLAAAARGRYKTKMGAARVMHKLGGRDVVDHAARVLGQPVGPGYAGRGDVVAVEMPEGVALAVVDNTGRRAVCPGKDGIVFVPMSKFLHAWKV